VILIFGSNRGDRAANIDRAIFFMQAIGTEEKRSALYESDPWGFTADTSFYNRVVVYRTSLAPAAVLRHCLATEQRLGRVRVATDRYTSRPIDIDILFYDSLVLHLPDLVIPHPRIAQRRFVLLPLAEILPSLLHPTHHKTIFALLKECPDTGNVSALLA
jgi:2-amino-4-hydroxy-6-hydroxymethyldihydropteridine diphosphokinase